MNNILNKKNINNLLIYILFMYDEKMCILYIFLWLGHWLKIISNVQISCCFTIIQQNSLSSISERMSQ